MVVSKIPPKEMINYLHHPVKIMESHNIVKTSLKLLLCKFETAMTDFVNCQGKNKFYRSVIDDIAYIQVLYIIINATAG